MRHFLNLLFTGGLALAAGAVEAEEKAQEAKVDSVIVDVGDPAPVFHAMADNGKLWKSSDLVGKKALVVYFFPAAMTGG